MKSRETSLWIFWTSARQTTMLPLPSCHPFRWRGSLSVHCIQPIIFFSHTKLAPTNQQYFFSHNKSAPAKTQRTYRNYFRDIPLLFSADVNVRSRRGGYANLHFIRGSRSYGSHSFNPGAVRAHKLYSTARHGRTAGLGARRLIYCDLNFSGRLL